MVCKSGACDTGPCGSAPLAAASQSQSAWLRGRPREQRRGGEGATPATPGAASAGNLRPLPPPSPLRSGSWSLGPGLGKRKSRPSWDSSSRVAAVHCLLFLVPERCQCQGEMLVAGKDCMFCLGEYPCPLISHPEPPDPRAPSPQPNLQRTEQLSVNQIATGTGIGAQNPARSRRAQCSQCVLVCLPLSSPDGWGLTDKEPRLLRRVKHSSLAPCPPSSSFSTTAWHAVLI
ncbi:uncharacterized protein [Castor canadensis]|uniref:Uncharacterized protein n=1 Tax=Castor canadensis TaxID=51338 RepID=A0AC58KJE3_CASCN